MPYISVTSYLAFATLIQAVTVALAKQCSYRKFDEVFYYICLDSQYCCGQNSCCYSGDYYYGVYDLWYFWFCLCFGIFICSLASGAYYRKRQLRGVQVAAIHARTHHGHGGNVQVMQDHWAMAGGQGTMARGPGTAGIMYPPPRNLMVTTTVASGQPMYPPQGYNEAQPNCPTYNTMGGPMYPAYAYMPPPPSYNSLAMGTTVTAPSSTSSTSPASSSSATSGSDVPPVST